MSGDVSEADLAMSEEDRQMIINDVHIIIHAAATIRYIRICILAVARGFVHLAVGYS